MKHEASRLLIQQDSTRFDSNRIDSARVYVFPRAAIVRKSNILFPVFASPNRLDSVR